MNPNPPEKDTGRLHDDLFRRVLAAELARDTASLVRLLANREFIGTCRAQSDLAEVALAARWTLGLHGARRTLAHASRCLDANHPQAERISAFASAAIHASPIRLTFDRGLSRIGAPWLPTWPVPVVNASINDLPVEPFIFDSGAPTTLLSTGFCDRAGLTLLQNTRFTHDASGNEFPIHPVPLHALSFAGVRIHGVVADAAPLQSALSVAGILSPVDILSAASIELDFASRRLRLIREVNVDSWSARMGGQVHSAPIAWHDGAMFVQAMVGKRSGHFLFDTGASATLLARKFACQMGFPPSTEAVAHTFAAVHSAALFGSLSADVSVATERPRPLTLTVRNDRVDDERQAPIATDGWLGVSWMTGRQILIERGGRRLHFTDTD